MDRGEDGELDLVAPSLDLAVEITLDGAKSRVVGMLDAVVALTSGDAFDVLLALVRRLRGKVAADPYFATPLYLERTGCDQVIEVLAGMGF